MQDFVGVRVADPAQDAGVGERALEGVALAGEDRRERLQIEIGVEDYLRDIRQFAECQSTGIWQPTKYGEVQTLKTPPYRMLDRQLAWRTPDGGTGFSDDGYTED